MIRIAARSRRLVAAAAALLSAAPVALAANGTIRPVTDGTVEATFVVSNFSGTNDRVITRYGVHPAGQPAGLLAPEFDPNAVICGARTFQGPAAGITSASFLDIRREDPGHPGVPDLMAPPFAFADGTAGGTAPRLCQGPPGFSDWTFGAGAGLPNLNQAFFLTFQFFPNQGLQNQCAMGVDTDSGVTGRCLVFDSASGFRDLGVDAFLEVVVAEPRATAGVDMSVRFHGVARFPGDLGSPVISLRTHGTRSLLPTTDKPSTTIKVDNTTMPQIFPVSVQFRLDGDLTNVTPGGTVRNLTHLFRTPNGQALDVQTFTAPSGRLVVQAAVPFVPDRFVSRTPVNVPMFAAMTRLDNMSVDREVGVLGLRPNPGTRDDNVTDAFVRPQLSTLPGDALAVRFHAVDFLNTSGFRISGVEVVGQQTGGGGLDAIQLRTQDPIIQDSPDLSPVGLLASRGVRDGIGELPLANGTATRFDFVPDVAFTTGLQNDLWLIAYFPQETTMGVQLGSDRTFATLLGDSFFTLGNAEPFRKSPQDNYQLRLLLDGEFNTFAPPPAPTATPAPPSLEADHLRLYVGTVTPQ
jgi:hypothetical protein